MDKLEKYSWTKTDENLQVQVEKEIAKCGMKKKKRRKKHAEI